MAMVNVGLGEGEQAISWLEKAAEERDGSLPFTTCGFASIPSAPTPASKPSSAA